MLCLFLDFLVFSFKSMIRVSRVALALYFVVMLCNMPVQDYNFSKFVVSQSVAFVIYGFVQGLWCNVLNYAVCVADFSFSRWLLVFLRHGSY